MRRKKEKSSLKVVWNELYDAISILHSVLSVPIKSHLEWFPHIPRQMQNGGGDRITDDLDEYIRKIKWFSFYSFCFSRPTPRWIPLRVTR